ncbi:hypothetical protein [Bacteroides heparinolyticus]|uniref:hypothetical protein n=1 Tax=Prevotella heparinolytica TaxID=28113 RepID=UPI0035A0FB77
MSFVVFNGARSQQGKEQPYTTKDWQIAPKITSRFATWFNVAYELSFSLPVTDEKHGGRVLVQ